jgi:glycerate kinase
VPGFSLVAEEVGFYDAVVESDIVVTGEGRLDETSFSGKVVGNVINVAHQHGKRVIALCGDVQPDGKRLALREGADVVSLRERFGDDATNFTERCVRESAELALATD